MSEHITEELARRAVHGELTPEEQSVVDAHLLICPPHLCPALMERVADSSVDTVVDEFEEENTPEVPGYHVEGEIGRGGMGVIYRVHDRELRRTVAIKVMQAKFRRDPAEFAARKKRFLDEAYIVAQLQHPGITPIYELGTLPEPDGRPFFAAKLVRGKTLGALLQERQSLEQDRFRFLQIFASICDCLAYAHERNVIHRDLKPCNVMVDERFQVVHVLDWGIGKVRSTDSEESEDGTVIDTPNQDPAFQTRGALGTYPYMSREQAMGRSDQVDARIDVFGLGAILCEILTGRPPYFSEHQDAAVRSATVRQAAEDGDIDSALVRLDTCRAEGELVTLGKRCLAKNREKRPADAGEVTGSIAEYRRKVEARVHRQKLMRWMLVAAAVILVVLVAGIIGTLVGLRQASENEQTAKKNEQTAKENERIAKENERIAKAETVRADEATDRANRHASELKAALVNADMLAKYEEAAKERTVKNLALTQVGFANQLYERNEVSRARNTLKAVPPRYRGWEWGYFDHKFEGSFMTCYGHTLPVVSVCFGPEGKRIASAGEDGSIRIWDATLGTELLTLKGHSDTVQDVCFTPDGKRVVSCGDDSTIRIWNLLTGEAIHILRGHTVSVESISVSPDGRRIVSGNADSTVRTWNADTGKPIHVLKGQLGSIKSVCYSSNGGQIASGSDNGTICIWKVQTGQILRVLRGHTDCVNSVCFSPEDQQIVSGSEDKTVRVWDAINNTKPLILKEHGEAVNRVIFSPDGLRIASCSDDNSICVWTPLDERTKLILKGHTNAVNSVSFSPDGQRLVSSGSDVTVRMWNVVRGEQRLDFKGHRSPVNCVSVSPDGLSIASGSDDKTIRVWDPFTMETKLQYGDHTGSVRSVCFSPNGKHIASASSDRTVHVWNSQTGERVHLLKEHGDEVTTVSYSPDGRRIVSGSTDGSIRLWDSITGRTIQTLQGKKGSISSVAFSPDGQRIASGNRSDSSEVIQIWDLQTSTILYELTGHIKAICGVQYSLNGQYLVSGSWDGTMRVWEAKEGQLKNVLIGHTKPVYSFAISKDSSRLISGSEDGTVRIWDIPTGKEVCELNTYSMVVQSVCFSPDEKRLILGNKDGTVHAWTTRNDRSDLELTGHVSQITCVAFCPDGTRMATGDAGSLIRIWDLRTGKSVQLLQGHTDEVSCLSFSPNGDRLVSGSWDGTLRVWNLTTGTTIHLLDQKQEYVLCLDFSPDGQRIVSGNDRKVHVWDANSGKLLLVRRGHLDEVTTVLFSPSGRLVASASEEGRVHVWDANSGTFLSSSNRWPDWTAGRVWNHKRRRRSNIVVQDTTLVAIENHVLHVIPKAAPTKEEMAFRLAMSRFDTWWAKEQANLAVQEKHLFAVSFYRSLELEHAPWQCDTWDQAGQVARELDDFGHPLAVCDRLVEQRSNFAPFLWHRAKMYRLAKDDFRSIFDLCSIAFTLSLGRNLQTEPKYVNEANKARRFLLAWLAEPSNPWHLHRKAWYDLRQDNTEHCRETLQLLWQRFHFVENLTRPVTVSTVLCNDLAPAITPLRGIGPLIAKLALDQFKVSQTDAICYTAALLPDCGGLPVNELATLTEANLAQHVNSWSYLETLGAVRYRASRFTEAMQALEAAAKLNESNWQCFLLAMSYHKLGQIEKARDWFDKAIPPSEDTSWEAQLIWNRRHKEAAMLLKIVE